MRQKVPNLSDCCFLGNWTNWVGFKLDLAYTRLSMTVPIHIYFYDTSYIYINNLYIRSINKIG